MSASEGRMGGWMLFGGVMMILIGAWTVIEGVLGLLDPDAVLALQDGNVYLVSLSTWSWMHLLLGTLVFFTGFGVLNVSSWARIVGIILVGISLISRMFTISVHPFWGLVIILMEVMVIYALAVYNDPNLE